MKTYMLPLREARKLLKTPGFNKELDWTKQKTIASAYTSEETLKEYLKKVEEKKKLADSETRKNEFLRRKWIETAQGR
jgi:hypothetical protein